MKERPIIFDAESVRAILAGIKTQTRRVVKLRPPYQMDERDDGTPWPYATTWSEGDAGTPWMPCPYGAGGDRLWAREAWMQVFDTPPIYAYRAEKGLFGEDTYGRWRSPIHMPRAASRITLRVDDVRVQRVQNIDEYDARAEGVVLGTVAQIANANSAAASVTHCGAFSRRWDAINAKRGYTWSSNPWVWAVTFSVVAKEGGEA